MREQIAAELTIQGFFQTPEYVEISHLEMADAILALIREEIEKVENPYPPTRRCADEDGAIQEYINVSHTRVEEFRQKILALLKE